MVRLLSEMLLGTVFQQRGWDSSCTVSSHTLLSGHGWWTCRCIWAQIQKQVRASMPMTRFHILWIYLHPQKCAPNHWKSNVVHAAFSWLRITALSLGLPLVSLATLGGRGNCCFFQTFRPFHLDLSALYGMSMHLDSPVSGDMSAHACLQFWKFIPKHFLLYCQLMHTSQWKGLFYCLSLSQFYLKKLHGLCSNSDWVHAPKSAQMENWATILGGTQVPPIEGPRKLD